MTENVVWHEGAVSREQRAIVTGGHGVTIWLTGLSGSGKSTIAREAEQLLVAQRRATYVLDGDNLRHGINSDLGFSKADRKENVRRIGEIARLMADAGFVVLVPVISPYAADREDVRRKHEDAGIPFLEVFVDTPLHVCEERDPKGLYAKARSGEIVGMTGVDDPYEAPEDASIRIDGANTDQNAAAQMLVQAVE